VEKNLWSVLDDGSRKVLPGQYTIFVGSSQPDNRSVELLGQAPLSKTVTIK
jgi:hypothetical protein